jgi:hypothetical protein
MWDYIVLGQIPGTQVQVNFEVWLIGTTGLVLLCLFILATHSNGSAVQGPLRKQSANNAANDRTGRWLQTAAYLQWLLIQSRIQA